LLPADTQARGQFVRALALMTFASVLFGCMAITIRYATHQLHAFEVAFFRNFFGLLFALPILLRTGLSVLRTTKLPLYFLRCVIGLVSMLAGFWAIAHLPLAQAVSLTYSSPLFVTIGAVLVLGEIVGIRRWSAVLLGFAGVLIIVRPGAEGFSAAALVALLAAAMSASVSISIKFLSRTESADSIVLYTTLIWTPLSLFPALAVWQWPTPASWFWCAFAGLLGTCGHMAWTRALRLGDVSVLTPINYVQLPVVALLAYLLFGEALDRYTALGSAIIFLANAYIARREAMLSRRTVTAPEVVREVAV
jgi:drug/metabolite transporter (DMT)-like permease